MISRAAAISYDRLETESLGRASAVRGLVWTYVFLLLFEGVFRKWLTPGLSGPLLIIRDPLLIVIYGVAATAGLFPKGGWMMSFWVLTIGSAFFGIIADHLDWKVFLFGMRTNFLHLPLMFVIYRTMTYRHIVRMGWWLLLFSIPMTILVLQQFRGSPDDWINIAAGGVGRQLETSGGKVRASGTFSFISGIVCFYGLVAGFLINGLLKRGTYPLWLQIAAAAGVVAAVATSGSRSALGAVLVVVASVVLVVLSKPAMLGRIIVALTVLTAVAGVATQFAVVAQGTENLTARFGEAGGSAGIWPRVFGVFMVPIHVSGSAPLFGYGLGYGTNAGAALASSNQFVLGEGEWERVIGESGPIMGNLFILWRIAFLIFLFRLALREIQSGNVLPLLLLSAAGPLILNGPFGQPTTLGFAVLGGGLCLAATRLDEEKASPSQLDRAVTRSAGLVRGRSRYAEILHGRR